MHIVQVHSAPSVNAPDKFHAVTSDHTSLHGGRGDNNTGSDQSPTSYNSPTTQTKLAFGLKKASNSSGGQNQPMLASQGKSKLERVFSAVDDEEVETKPKKKLVPIEYSDEEEEEERNSRRSPRSPERKRSRRSSGRESSRRSSGHHGGGGDVGLVARGSSLSSGDGLSLEDVKDRKLSGEDRKKLIQSLVNNIPTSKEEVFKYQLKWDQIDKVRKEKLPALQRERERGIYGELLKVVYVCAGSH